MCSRFELSSTPRDLARRFGLKTPPPVPNAAESHPTNQALVIEHRDGAPAGRLLPWGLRVGWSKQPLINARAETLTEKPTFRPLLGRRCLVPASAYFEWRHTEGAKLKNRIAPESGGLMAFAGLTDGEHFTIVTCAPVTAIAHIHDRMPVILEAAAEPRWIDPAVDFPSVAGLLRPFTADGLTAVEEAPPPDRQKDLFG